MRVRVRVGVRARVGVGVRARVGVGVRVAIWRPETRSAVTVPAATSSWLGLRIVFGIGIG